MIGPIPGAKICRNPSALPPSLQMLCVSTPPKNFEDQYKFEGFLQTAVQTDYMHGRLSPRIVVITDVSGIFAFAPTATYRFRDDLLFTATYIAIAATRKEGIGAFRDHDMVQLRVTYQLN